MYSKVQNTRPVLMVAHKAIYEKSHYFLYEMQKIQKLLPNS